MTQPFDFSQHVNSVNHLYTQVNLKWRKDHYQRSPGTQPVGEAICIATLLPRAGQVQVLKITFHKTFAQSINVSPFCLYLYLFIYFLSHGIIIGGTRRTTRRNVETTNPMWIAFCILSNSSSTAIRADHRGGNWLYGLKRIVEINKEK